MASEMLKRVGRIASQPQLIPQRLARKTFNQFVIDKLPDNFYKKGFFPTDNVLGILNDIGQSHDLNGFEWKILSRNIIPWNDSLFLCANKEIHPDMWLRDSFHALEYIDSPAFTDNVLKSFERRQRKNGQIPTAVNIMASTPWHFADDETTLLYLILTSQLKDKDPNFITGERRQHIRDSLQFIMKHVDPQGNYVTPAGPRRGWLDAFIYPTADVVTQNQGLFVLALLSAQKLNQYISSNLIENATQRYQDLAKSGCTPLSNNFSGSVDISALYPEYLAMTIFDKNLLSKQVVKKTLSGAHISRHGFVVLTANHDAEYFDPQFFEERYKKGCYQNGGVWPVWQNIALTVAELHGLIKPEAYRSRVIKQLQESNWPESIGTGGAFEDNVIADVPLHLWDIAIPIQHRKVDQLKKQGVIFKQAS